MRTGFLMKVIFLAAVLCAIGAAPALAASPYGAPAIEWQKLLGGTAQDIGWSVQQTTDGGYVFIGYTLSSANGDVTATSRGDRDVWVVKTDNAGTIQWQKLLGGTEWDEALSIQQTADGGYIVLGTVISSASGDVSGINHGGYDVWVVKLTSTGTIQWQKLLGGIDNDYGLNIRQTTDGGYIFVGYSFSSANGDVTGTNHGASDLWVVKLTSTGTVQWQKLLGGGDFDHGTSIVQTTDAGYIILGDAKSTTISDVTDTNHGNYDYWVLKLDSVGTVQWQKLLGGTADDQGYSVGQTTDGGYVLVGRSKSNGTGNVIVGNHGGLDIWVVKLNSAGGIQWQKLLGGSSDEYGYSGQQTSDGGYIVLGNSTSTQSGDVTGTNHGGVDYWTVKLGSTGAVQWQKLLGGSGADMGFEVRQAADGGYILVGISTSSASGDVTQVTHGTYDFWVVKITTVPGLQLNPGWNFVSVPAVLKPGLDTASIFAGVDTDSHSIFLYNTSTKTWTPMTSSTKVKALDGIWIYSNYATSVPLTFDPNPLSVPPEKELAAGWNAIGYASTSSATAKDALSPLTGKWSTVLGFDAETQRYDFPIYTGGSGAYSDSRELFSGKGYWLWMREPGQLSGPGV